jgi:hypothetical protein
MCFFYHCGSSYVNELIKFKNNFTGCNTIDVPE